jgi:acid phosphatase class B
MSQQKLHVRKGDTVYILTGKDAGKKGKVLQALPSKRKVLVEGVNVVKRHSRPTRSMVLVRAKLRRTSRIRKGLSSWPVAAWKRRRNNSSFRSISSLSSSSSVNSRNSLAFFTGLTTCFLPFDKPRLNGQFVTCQTHGLFGFIIRNPG